MIKKVWTSDLSIVAGLAIVVFSARFLSGALPQATEWISGLVDVGSEPETVDGGSNEPGGPTVSPIVLDRPEPTTSPAPIIVLSPSDLQFATCPAQ